MENNRKDFHRLTESGNAVFITAPKKFNGINNIDKYSVSSLRWAYDNAYNGHFKNSSRDKFKTMLDAFLGKLGEYAVYEFFKDLDYELELPEIILRQRGEWDDGDLFVAGQKVQVKTTVFTSNFLLLKRNDWDDQGNYRWGKDGLDTNYGAFFLCRLMPNPRQVFLKEESLEDLIKLCENISWRYEITGFMTKKDVIKAINENYIIRKGKMLNGKVKIQEDLIYFQSGDLKDPELIPRKKLTNAE